MSSQIQLEHLTQYEADSPLSEEEVEKVPVFGFVTQYARP